MTDILAPVNVLEVYRGANKTVQLQITDETGRVLNLTGAKVIFSVKESVSDPRPFIVKTTDDPTQIDVMDVKGGVVQIYLLPRDTQNRPIQQYVFDVWVLLSNGDQFPVIPPSTLDLLPAVSTLP